MGLALTGDNKLLVIFQKSQDLHVYDVQSFERLPLCPTKHSLGLKHPRGIAVDRQGRVYIIDWSEKFSGDLIKTSVEGTPFERFRVELEPFGISVSEDGESILVTCSSPVRIFLPLLPQNNKIFIFGSNGQVKLTVDLPEALEVARHALFVRGSTNQEFFVLSGWLFKAGQVAIVNEKGQELPVGPYGSATRDAIAGLASPDSLCDDGDGGLLVVDGNNHRIHHLNYRLQYVEHVLKKEHSPNDKPRHVCVDLKKGYLFVGFGSGAIRAFKVREPAAK